MIRKIKNYLNTHEKQYELLRYLIAGGLTTVLSFVVFSVGCMILSADHTIDGATTAQANASNVVAWIIAVVFAFWINRGMVFRQVGGSKKTIFKEFCQFVGGRLASLVLIEIGVFNLLLTLGMGNTAAKLVQLVLVMVFNYVVSKFWIYGKKSQASKAPGAIPAVEGDPQE